MTEDLEEGNSHFSYWEEALYIANPLTLPFYLFTFQHSEGLQMGHQMARHILHTVAATEVDT